MSNELDEIRARANAATEGPWEREGMDSGHSRYEMDWWIVAGSGDTVCDMDGLNRSRNEVLAKDDGGRDAEFIAHARTDVPRLLAALDAADKELSHRAEMLRETADGFLSAVINLDEHRDPELANRYDAYATQARAALVSFRRAITTALEETK